MQEVERQYVFNVMDVDKPGFLYCKMAKWCITTKKTLQNQVEV